MKGDCMIEGDVTGKITFIQEKIFDSLEVVGVLYNVPRGNHGFHIHEYGDVSNGCTSAGEHFNPFHKNHGGPKSLERHLGDLGNVYSDGSKTTRVYIKDDMLSLYGQYNILGRSLVVHAMEDDYGTGTDTMSKLTGNSGSRLGCGVIGVQYEKTRSF